jgi:transcriptional regulator with XRE-family HTH domain
MVTASLVGKNVRLMRERRNLTQKQLSERLFYRSPQFISDIERGKFFPKLITLNKLGTALECSVDDLLSLVLSTSTENLVPVENLNKSQLSTTTAVPVPAPVNHSSDTNTPTSLEPQQTALQKLEERVKTHGTTNAHGHKQLRDLVLANGKLLELTDDEPERVSESRAAKLL